MNNLWSDKEAQACEEDLLKLRVYTSRLLGRDESLVLHGGGNTSVKINKKNIFGEEEPILFVKGSGWDLATIEPQGFSPAKLNTLLKLATLDHLSDSNMVQEMRASLINPNAPTPSIEAILHALIPFVFVDHTHSDAVVTLTNTINGEKRIRDIYGNGVLVVPYVMPGFILAKKIWEMTNNIDWSKLDGIVLLNHGVFTFSNDAKLSYSRMIDLVTLAERELEKTNAYKNIALGPATPVLTERDALTLAELRKEASKIYSSPLIVSHDGSKEACGFSLLPCAHELAARGTITPDHVIHTKPWPMYFNNDIKAVAAFWNKYSDYFDRNTDGTLKCLDKAPRWAVWPDRGLLSFGTNTKKTKIIADIARHTIAAIQWGESLGGWCPLSEKPLFDVEYWELEQAKLKKTSLGPKLLFEGKVALVTGAASGIGRACAEFLFKQGAAVIGLDIDKKVTEFFCKDGLVGLQASVTSSESIHKSILSIISRFGGLDILVSNAGTFPAGEKIENLSKKKWKDTLDVNLTGHFLVLKNSIPFLKFGIDPCVIFIASKNVAAPGPGASAYSTAKAGLTQLARVAALELAPYGIRVNTIHPDAVFDTALWTQEVLKKRADVYGLSVAEYKTKNLLRTHITSADVAHLVATIAGSAFSKTTGAQIPIDGGNDRVI
ncbi:MAG: bifunctional aldolase/short-chain dehydrogenase [Deltaproteobacteria bacterium]|nr:bifunctional aldolase/short-chain dehydrogenase [Deltaproteobacteria bacterium]